MDCYHKIKKMVRNRIKEQGLFLFLFEWSFKALWWTLFIYALYQYRMELCK